MFSRGEITSAFFWKFFERGGRAVIELTVQIVLARMLAPSEFGVMAIMLVVINLGNTVLQYGLGTSLVQARTISSKDTSTVFWMAVLISTVIYACLWGLAPLFESFYEVNNVTCPLRVLGLALLFGAYNSIQMGLLQRALEYRRIFWATTSSAIISGVLAIVVAATGFGLWALVIQQVTFYVSCTVMLSYQTHWIPGTGFDFSCARHHLSYGGKLMAAGVVDQLYNAGVEIAVGKQFTALWLGYLSQGRRYPQALGMLLDGAIQPVMLSAVARLQDSTDDVLRLVRRALRTSVFAVFPVSAALFVTARPLVTLVLGERWLPSVPFLQVFCIVYALLPIHSTNLQALNGIGRSGMFLKLELVKKCYGVACLASAIFVLQDVFWVALSYVITGVIGTIVNSYPVAKYIGYTYLQQVRDILPVLVITLIAAVCAHCVTWLELNDVATVIVQILTMFVMYFALVFLFRLDQMGNVCTYVREFTRC